MIDLTSPTEAEDEKNEKDYILYADTKIIEKHIQAEEQPNNEEEHGTVDENTDNNTITLNK